MNQFSAGAIKEAASKINQQLSTIDIDRPTVGLRKVRKAWNESGEVGEAQIEPIDVPQLNEISELGQISSAILLPGSGKKDAFDSYDNRNLKIEQEQFRDRIKRKYGSPFDSTKSINIANKVNSLSSVMVGCNSNIFSAIAKR